MVGTADDEDRGAGNGEHRSEQFDESEIGGPIHGRSRQSNQEGITPEALDGRPSSSRHDANGQPAAGSGGPDGC